MSFDHLQNVSWRQGVWAILFGGTLAGALDLVYNIAVFLPRGVSAMVIVQFTASGLLGKQAFMGGFATAVLGLLLHFFIAITAASLYFLASRKLSMLVTRPVLSGISYGAAIFLFMELVVLPLSAMPKVKVPAVLIVGDVFAHLFLVGLAIAFGVRQAYVGKELLAVSH